MRSKLSFMAAACLALVSLVALSGCANNSATTGGANAASSSASPTTSSQTVAAQSNATNSAAAGQTTTGAGSSGSSSADASKGADACALLTSDDVKAVQGEPVKDAKSSSQDSGQLRVAQCFFTTATFNKSVSLEVTTSADGRAARSFWDERFARAREEAGKGEKERAHEEREKKGQDADKKKDSARGEEEEEGTPPTPVKGVGEEAYWTGNRAGGTLYARKGGAFVRVSIGGSDSDAERQRKAKALAERALARL